MSNDFFEGRMSISAGNSKAELPALPTPIIEALHKAVTGRRESVNIFRRNNRELDIDGVIQLINYLEQWTGAYNVVSRSMTLIATVASEDHLKGRSRYRFRDLEAFKSKYQSLSEETKSLEISFEVVIENRDAGTIDTTEVVIDFLGETRQYLLGSDAQNPIGGSYRWRNRLDDIDSEDVTLRVSARYTNYLVAKALVGVIDDWYANLPAANLHKYGRIIRKINSVDIYDPGSIIGYMLKMLPWIFALLLVYLAKRASLIPNNLDIIDFSLITAISGFVIGLFLVRLSAGYESVGSPKSIPLVKLTIGDKKRIEKFNINVEDRASKEQAVNNFFIVGVGASILGTVILALLGIS